MPLSAVYAFKRLLLSSFFLNLTFIYLVSIISAQFRLNTLFNFIKFTKYISGHYCPGESVLLNDKIKP